MGTSNYSDSPKNETMPTPRNTMEFGLALEALKQGKLVAREGWNGKGMFLFIRPEFSCGGDAFMSIQSVPDNAKVKIVEALNQKFGDAEKTYKFTAYITMFAADGSIVNGWLASQTDMQASDWVIV